MMDMVVAGVSDIMNRGGICGIPTDVVYVLVAAVKFPSAVQVSMGPLRGLLFLCGGFGVLVWGEGGGLLWGDSVIVATCGILLLWEHFVVIVVGGWGGGGWGCYCCSCGTGED